ncbi:hypothetical protein I6E29_05250 [Arcanobacterium haemolyticum]|nr:hypothetical protein [Arcanobacterium haemolyticum]
MILKALRASGGTAPVVGAAGDGRPASVTDRVLAQLRGGATIRSAAAACGVSEIFVSTMADHFERLGMLTSASSLCSSGLGACSADAVLSDEARVHCAGCPLSVH